MQRGWVVIVLASGASAPVLAADAGDAAAMPWSITPLYSHSALSGDRPDWNEVDVGLDYRVNSALSLEAHVDRRGRFGKDDTLYSIGFSHHIDNQWEWHGALTQTPGAEFSANHIYALGTEWRPSAHFSLLLDVREWRFDEFDHGTLHEIKPGVIVWFDDATWLTVQYWHDSGFGRGSFNSRGLRADHVFDNGSRLTLSLSDGVEPDRDVAVPTTLVKARLGSVVGRIPLGSRFAAIAGFERSVLPGLYGRNTFTVGVTARF